MKKGLVIMMSLVCALLLAVGCGEKGDDMQTLPTDPSTNGIEEVPTAPEATTPETTPEATTPEATTPETTPEATTPETTPEATTPEEEKNEGEKPEGEKPEGEKPEDTSSQNGADASKTE